MTVKQRPSEVPLWWRLLVFVAAASSGMAVLFTGEFHSLGELAVRLVGATFIAVTVYTVWANAGANRSEPEQPEVSVAHDCTNAPPR